MQHRPPAAVAFCQGRAIAATATPARRISSRILCSTAKLHMEQEGRKERQMLLQAVHAHH